MDQNNEHSARRRRPLRRWLGNIALMMAVFAAIQWWQTRPLASGTAPLLKGLSVRGEHLDLTEHRGHPVLVYFWAEWCAICRVEQDSILSIAGDFPVISIAMQSGDAMAVLKYQIDQQFDIPVIADPHSELAGLWGVKNVPTIFIIGPDGDIAHTAVGYTTEAGLRARLWSAGKL